MKLRTIAKNCSTSLTPHGQPGVSHDQMMLSNRLLASNSPHQWGPTTTVPNPGPVSYKVAPAYPLQAQKWTCSSWELPRSRAKCNWRKTYLLIMGITPLWDKMSVLILQCRLLQVQTNLASLPINLFWVKTQLPFQPLTLLLMDQHMLLL